MRHVELRNMMRLSGHIYYETNQVDGKLIHTLVLPQFEEPERNEKMKEKLLEGNLDFRVRHAGLGSTVYEVMYSGNKSSGLFIKTDDYYIVASLLEHLKPNFFKGSESDTS